MIRRVVWFLGVKSEGIRGGARGRRLSAPRLGL